jgi:Ca2+-binding EF-hand superfamily protein
MNSISGVGNSIFQMPNSSYGVRKPDPEEAAQRLFEQLDTSGQGYIEKSDLASVLEKVVSVSQGSSLESDETDLDELFSQIDTDGDGKITEQELTNSFVTLDEQINDLFSQMRMKEAMSGMAPPPPPPPEGVEGENDVGFTEEELMAQLDEIGDSDPQRSSLIENILANFDEADTDGDGRVNLQEAMAFDQGSVGSAVTSEDSDSTSANVSDTSLDEKVALQIIRLLHAYGFGSGTEDESSSVLSVDV